MPGTTHTLTTLDVDPAEIPQPTTPVRTRRESWGGWLDFDRGGWGVGFGPHGYRELPWFTATGTPSDRRGGRQLPLFWSEIDLRGFRLVARDLDSRNQFAIGFLNLLTAYHVHKGYGWQACLRGTAKTPYPTPKTDDPTVKKAQRILDAWRDANRWALVSREAFRRWRRDGEVFGRFFFGGWDKLPAFRFVDPERVGSPTGDVNTAKSFGIDCDPEDVQTRYAYHVWEADDYTRGEWVDADLVVHATANVDTGVKRGVTDFLPLSDDLGWVRTILRSMLVTTQRQSSKAWIEKIPGATALQVSNDVPQYAGRNRGLTAPTTDPYSGYRGYGFDPRVFEPDGSIMKTEGDREFVPTPGASPSGYIEVIQASLRGCGARYGMPEFFSGDASNNNMASSLVAHAPFVRIAEGTQYEYGQVWERPVALKVLDLAAEAGLLTAAERAQLDVEVTEPQVASAEPDKDATTNNTLHAAGVLSATTWQLKLGLDPQHEQANFDAERQQGMMPGEEKPGQGDDGQGTQGKQDAGQGTDGDELAQLASRMKTREDAGTPPFPGAVFDKSKHRWVKPQDAKGGDASQAHPAASDPPPAEHMTAGLAEKVAQADPEAAKDKGLLGKLGDLVVSAGAKVYLTALKYHEVITKGVAILEAVFDTPQDMKEKLGYDPSTTSATSHAGSPDQIKAATGISGHIAILAASHALAAAVTWAKKKLGLAEGAGDLEQLAEAVAAMLAGVAEEFGLATPPDAGAILERLRAL